MSERLVVLHFSTADCLSGKAEAGRPSFGGRRTVCCFGTALKCQVRQALQRFRSRHLCVAAEKGMRCGAPMFSRPT